MNELLYEAMKLGYKYQIRYHDYPEGQFTMPVSLTENRIYEMSNDKSVAEIRILIKP